MDNRGTQRGLHLCYKAPACNLHERSKNQYVTLINENPVVAMRTKMHININSTGETQCASPAGIMGNGVICSNCIRISSCLV